MEKKNIIYGNDDEFRKKYFRDYYRKKSSRSERCECGCMINHANKSKHLLTKKHNQLMSYLESLNEKTN